MSITREPQTKEELLQMYKDAIINGTIEDAEKILQKRDELGVSDDEIKNALQESLEVISKSRLLEPPSASPLVP